MKTIMNTIQNTGYLVIKPLALALLVSVFFVTLEAAANDNNWFIGASAIGRVTVDRNVSDFDDGSITSGRVDDKDSGWKFFGGYQFNQYFSLEFGRADLNNDPDSETTFTGQSDGTGSEYAVFVAGTEGFVSVDIDEPIAYYLASVGRLPLPLGPAPYDDRLSLLGKIGITAWDATQTIIDSNGKTEEDIDGTDILFGLALEYKWPNGVAIRSEWEFYKGIVDEDYELYTLGLTYNF